MAFKSSLFPIDRQTLGDAYSNNYSVASNYYSPLDRYTGGELWRWGRNNVVGENIPYEDSANTGYETNWVHVESGQSHSIGIKDDSTVWTWGGNGTGQLGVGLPSGSNRSSPVQVTSTPITNSWLEISAGLTHNLALTKNGQLRSWGSNSNGELGDGGTSNATTPVFFIPNMSGPYAMVQGVAGSGYSMGIAETTFNHAFSAPNVQGDRTLWAAGNNLFGQLGDGTTNNRSVTVRIGNETNWKSVCAGPNSNHTFGFKTDGTTWAWGLNDQGQLGLNDTISRSSPVQIGTTDEWAFFSLGSYSTLGIKKNGTLWAWGLNTNGQLGLNDTISRSSPVQIGTDRNWRIVRAISNHCFGIKTDGSLWAWGYNDYKQLGHSDTNSRSSPTQIPGLVDYKWKSVTGNWLGYVYGIKFQ